MNKDSDKLKFQVPPDGSCPAPGSCEHGGGCQEYLAMRMSPLRAETSRCNHPSAVELRGELTGRGEL